jgi:hypothetical protein
MNARQFAVRCRGFLGRQYQTLLHSNIGLSRSRRDLYKAHLLNVLASTETNVEPFWTLEVGDVLHPELYAALDNVRRKRRGTQSVTTREEYSTDKMAVRYSFARAPEKPVRHVRALFSDDDVKRAILERFFTTVDGRLLDEVCIWDHAFEFTFSPPGKAQHTHVDWPTKFVSLIIYFPDEVLGTDEQLANATMFYDRDLVAQPIARFAPNRAAMFAAHFESYHGFSTTRDRDALVVFYLNTRVMDAWRNGDAEAAEPTVEAFKDAVQRKMTEYPLREFPTSADVQASRERSLIDTAYGQITPADV